MLWNIALVLFLCETLVWETTQRAALFWSINFNTLTLKPPSIFEHAGQFEVQQFGDPDVIEDKAVDLRGRWGPIPGRNAFEFNTRYRIKKVSRNLLNPNSAIGHSKFMCLNLNCILFHLKIKWGIDIYWSEVSCGGLPSDTRLRRVSEWRKVKVAEGSQVTLGCGGFPSDERLKLRRAPKWH